MLSMMFAITASLVTAGEPQWKLVLDQSFQGPAGQAPDPKVWNRDLGGGGFGNNELQSYTDGNKNAFFDGKGHLVIEARKEPTKGSDGIARDYSSARLKTLGKYHFKFGRAEARVKLPKGKGIWPAFWAMGENITTVGWPKCGEIDIMEFLGHEETTAYGTLHGPGYFGGGGRQGKWVLPNGKKYTEDFHTFGIEWGPGDIKWLIDGHVYHEVKRSDVEPNEWPFDAPHFLLLNLAVGGGWPGYPDATTVFPQRMLVDYVRVYQRKP